ncbi:hypothetical protein N806_07155 [Rhodococcus sp. P27]|nr:hypothetical protein N806_07155 [Rhodococcus sp. P27]
MHAQSSADEAVVGDSSPPGGGSRRYLEQLIRYDVPASLVVFLVALPLSLGIAIASGAPIMAGLIAAIVGGVVAGAVGGSPLQVSGPAAGLTVVVAELIGKFGWKVTCLITVGAGILQIVFGLSRIARAALAIAPVVVHAMLAGIGITIALQQVHVLLGGSSASSALDNLRQLPAQIGALHVEDLMIGLVVIATLLGWRYLPAASGRCLRHWSASYWQLSLRSCCRSTSNVLLSTDLCWTRSDFPLCRTASGSASQPAS